MKPSGSTRHPPRQTGNAPAVRHVKAGEEQAGQRLDNFLARQLKGAPKSLLYRVLRKGEVRVNGKRAKPDYRVQLGDDIRLPPVRLGKPGQSVPASAALKAHLTASILYEDPGLLVLDKPAGLAVHGGSGVSLGLIEVLRQSRPDEKSLELVHRLDRETSGCLLVAKKRSALRFLQEALREHQVRKTYVALVKGRWPKRKTVVESRLEKFELDSGERRVKTSEVGKLSRTEFRILGHYRVDGGECTLVEAMPVTGRTHQIRVHAQSVGCPLVGDDKYTDDAFNAIMKRHGFKRLFLHAAKLEFPLPPVAGIEGGMMTVEAPLPADIASPLEKLTKISSRKQD